MLGHCSSVVKQVFCCNNNRNFGHPTAWDCRGEPILDTSILVHHDPLSTLPLLSTVSPAADQIVGSPSAQKIMPTEQISLDPKNYTNTMAEAALPSPPYIDASDAPEEDDEEFEYEEVTLQRRTARDQLGLTLCYTSPDNVDTDIFVGEVIPQSIAAGTGRIYTGDQILQINGHDVHTRSQAIRLFQGSKRDVTLLLARKSPERDDVAHICELDDDTIEPDLISELTAHSHMKTHEVILEATEDDEAPDRVEIRDDAVLSGEERRSAGSAHEKDSGISRTTDSENEQAVAAGTPKSSSLALSPPIPKRVVSVPVSPEYMSTTPSDALGNQLPLSTFVPFECPMQRPTASTSPVIPAPGQLYRSESEGSLACELAKLNREMQHIQLECDRLVERYATQEQRVRQQVLAAQNFVSQVDGRLRKVTDQPRCKTMGKQPFQAHAVPTSSAYNTAEDSLNPTPRTAYGTSVTMKDPKRDSAVFTTISPAPRSKPQPPPRADKPVPQQRSTKVPTPTTYTNAQNLQDTMIVQQRLLRDAMLQQAKSIKSLQPRSLKKGPVAAPSETFFYDPVMFDSQAIVSEKQFRPPPTAFPSAIQQARAISNGTFYSSHDLPPDMSVPAQSLPEYHLQYKIKRRSDGSRYVQKRLVRNKILGRRAEQLERERMGVTTDDDAHSEIKTGRYWSRNERKRHMEKGRARKEKQKQMLLQKAEARQVQNSPDIVAMAARKLERRKAGQMFDGFTTIQEFLAHGNRDNHQDPSKALGILSVTTV